MQEHCVPAAEAAAAVLTQRGDTNKAGDGLTAEHAAFQNTILDSHLLSNPERLKHVVDAEMPAQTMESTLLQGSHSRARQQ
jgi:hypothetical protein